MPYCFDNLESFARQFAGNWRSFLGFIWTRNEIADPEQWGIIYTKNSQSTPIEIVNAEHLKHLLWVYLHHESKGPNTQKQVHEIRDRHFAAGWTEGFLIRVYAPYGTITNPCTTLYDHLSALREYPVADDEALDKLEAEMFAEDWPDIVKYLVAEFDGERLPFFDGDCKLYIDLRDVGDTSGISRLFLKHHPRQYWSSDNRCFRIHHFLYDVMDGRITFAEMLAACPDTTTPTVSAELAESKPQEQSHDSPQCPEIDQPIQHRPNEFEGRRLAQ